jgi:hypothetical protein
VTGRAQLWWQIGPFKRSKAPERFSAATPSQARSRRGFLTPRA